MNAQDTATAALNYVARGWAVVALHDVTGGMCSCGAGARDGGDHDRSQGGKHPLRTGWQNAGMRSAAAVAEAWARRPTANIGIVTGRASGIWVLDVDPEHAGDRQLAGLVAAFGGLPETYAVRTGSGGTHYYWAMPGFDFTTSRGRLPVGLDVRGNAGQVVAPPSRTLKGSYVVLADVPVVDAPGWLLAMIQPAERPETIERVDAAAWLESPAVGERGAAYARVAVRELLAQLAAAAPGERNSTAARIARRLSELVNATWSGLDGEVVAAWYMDAAARCDIDGGFSQSEALDVLHRAVRAINGRAAELPPPSHLGTTWEPPASDFDQAGQDPASPFSNPGQIGTSIPVAVPMINDIAEQPKGEAEIIDEAFENAVRREMGVVIVRREAARRVDASDFVKSWRVPTDGGTLTDQLALPEEPVLWRVAGLLPAGGNAVVVAPRKAGKTTLMGSLVRSLVDGAPFLGKHAASPSDGAVALFNYENTARQQRDWLRSLGIENTDQVHVLHLRGSALTLSVPAVRAFVIGWLRARDIRVWIPDPYARAGQGVVLNENDNGQANAFTGLLDEIKVEAGVSEIVMPCHASNKGDVESGSETMRGAGRVEDWADAIWYLTAVEGQRFLRATGRDVEMAETQLHFDTDSRWLTTGAPGRGRREVALERDAAAVSSVLRGWDGAEPATQNDLQTRADLGSPRRVSSAVRWLVERDLAWIEAGPRGAKYHHHGPKPVDLDKTS